MFDVAAEDFLYLWVRPSQLEERAEQIRSKSYLIQVEREKMQMELSHKRARVELERAANTSARNYEVGPGGQCLSNQPLGTIGWMHAYQAVRSQEPARAN